MKKIKDEKIPQAPDIERAILAEMILDNETITPVTAAGGETLFYKPLHKLIFKAIDALNVEGEDINQISVIDKLRSEGNLDKIGGDAVILNICEETMTTACNERHIAELKDLEARRQLINLSITTRNSCFNGGGDLAAIVSNIDTQLNDIKNFIINKKLNLTEAITEWINVTDGDFFVTECDKEINIVTKRDKDTRRKVFQRLVEKSIIEKYSNKRGHYRLVNVDCDKIDWQNAPTETLDIKFPFGIEQYVEIMPGNIIVIAGEANAGKTAFLLNVIRLNMNDREIHYFNSEMGDAELRKRLGKFDDVNLKDWKFKAWERSFDFADVIKPNAVNLVDFLEIHEDFYRVSGLLKSIHDKLEKGIAIIAIQKNKGSDSGLSGARGLELPRLYLSMEPGKVKIIKGKNWKMEGVNPNGLEIGFKLVQGCKFIPNGSGWHHPEK